MQRESGRGIVVSVASFIIAILLSAPCLPASSASGRITVDLHPYGFPADSGSLLFRVFYLSDDRIALFFDQPPASLSPRDHAFKLMVLDRETHITAQLVIHGDPKAMDVMAGPGGGLLFGRGGELSFYDSNLQLLRTIPLVPGTTGVRYDRRENQLVVMTADEKSGQRTAHFRDGTSLEECGSLSYPLKSQAVFGKQQLAYDVTGNCKGAAHVVSSRTEWHSLDQLLACAPLTFVTDDSLAIASPDHLYVVGSSADKKIELRIPESSLSIPGFIGLSDDRARLAVSVLRRKRMSAGWPYFTTVLVYDLPAKRMIFKEELENGTAAQALSPDGRQLATIQRGILTLTSIQ